MKTEDIVFDLMEKFERPGVKVVTEIPPGIKVAQVIGVHENSKDDVRVTVRKGDTLFLCVVNRDVAWVRVMEWKNEIAARPNWDDRWEPWEISAEDGTMSVLRDTLLKSRLRPGERDLDDVKLFLL